MSRPRVRGIPFGPARRFEIVANTDGTCDLVGVEILSVGGPVHGIGSPPEGDFWTLEELRGMAEADAELGDELLPPNKIGHPDAQTLVANSIDAGDLPLPEDGELPAVGWLEDLRVEGTKLLADVRHVPKIVADLIERGAWRTRSVELSTVTSQTSGKRYEWVVTGLAWLGGKMPAVRTLGDVVALYAGELPVSRRYVTERELETGALAWAPEEGLEHLRAIVNEALNPGPSTMDEPARYWVRDVAPGKALVEDWTEEAGIAWVVPFEITEGRAIVAAASDWTRAEQAWVEVGRANETRLLTLRGRPADTRTMRYTEEQRRKFAEAVGLEPDKATDVMLEAAGIAGETDPAPDPEPTEPAPEPTEPAPDEPSSKALEARVAGLEAELRIERRTAFVEDAIKTGRIEPGQRKAVEELFDLHPDRARAFVETLPERTELVRELGSDEDDRPVRARELADDDGYATSTAARLGIREEAIV